MYYAIYDNELGGILKTGRNNTSFEDTLEDLRGYLFHSEFDPSQPYAKIKNMGFEIVSRDFKFRVSKKPPY